jgi:hypothetical protein
MSHDTSFDLKIWGWSVWTRRDGRVFRDEAIAAGESRVRGDWLDCRAHWDHCQPYLQTIMVGDEHPPEFWCCPALVQHYYLYEPRA